MRRSDSPSLYDLCAGFAAQHLAPRQTELRADDVSVGTIWEQMQNAGLFRAGSVNSYQALTMAGEALARYGRNAGVALSWLYQQLVTRYLMQGYGSDAQCGRFLTPMTQGDLPASFAVSEPKRGAHPKYLTTTARKDGMDYILNGEKTYLTNGPLARLFIVVAVTDEQTPRKRFTAFLVPADTPGLTIADPLHFPFLKPCPHGGIRLIDCRCPATAILGEADNAYERMVIPFGEAEDTVMRGLAVGGLAGQMDLVVAALKNQTIKDSASLHGELGTLAGFLESFRVLAYEDAGRLDRCKAPSNPLAIAFAEMAAGFPERLEKIMALAEIEMNAEYDFLKSDLSALTSIKKRALQAKSEKLGAALLQGVTGT